MHSTMHSHNHHTKALQKFGEQIPFCEPYVQFNSFFQMNLLTKQTDIGIKDFTVLTIANPTSRYERQSEISWKER